MKPIPHGTLNGHRRHYLNGVLPPCDACKAVRKEYNRGLVGKKRAWLDSFKTNRGCFDCGIQGLPPYCYDFDHLEDKEIGPSLLVNHKWETIYAEVAKCEVVCANCHRIRTFNPLYARNMHNPD